ncbi:sinalpyl alcohol oxidase Nec3-like [Diospyros lotus]|uniref:sinalpyl alcohol oxidase Nec3-like n=1 Tax=Diospyros lotus TaxID=55363 RepID=UPI002254182C|nr:sinalpyl alcohol oxidase Nec3-like [Diospyros lotus]
MQKPELFAIFFFFIFLIVSQPRISLAADQSYQQDQDYLKFVRDAIEFPSREFYDYIVVGGGTVGCPLATTLSTSHSVLLLERGSSPRERPEVLLQANTLNILLEADDKDSPAQPFTSEDGVPNVRGRILGGGTMINYGFYSRADPYFYTNSGIEWDMKLVNESYKWVEETIVSKPIVGTWSSSVKEALLQAGNGPDNGFTFDHIIGTKIGGSTFDGNGRRHGAVELLNKALSNNIQVAIHATVERVIFSSNSQALSAVGVIYSDSKGKLHRAMLKPKGEVILSAGTLGSPQLLLLSGVGPMPYLSSLKIPTVKHHPSVGQFLVDNPTFDVHIAPPFEVQDSTVAIAGITEDYYKEAVSGPFPFNSPASVILFPNLSPLVNFTVLSVLHKLARPLSSGSLSLASSTNVTATPKVRFNYLSNPTDLAKCVLGTKNLVKVINSQVMEKYKFPGLNGTKEFKFVGASLPKDKADDAAFETYCRKMLTTFCHYHGGSVVGKVVDPHFNVIGIGALRVVDASTFNSSPGTNPQATLMMLGRYVGLRILEERESS